MKEELTKFSVTISKKIADEWYKTVNFNKAIRHPVRTRLEEALLDNIKKHKENKI